MIGFNLNIIYMAEIQFLYFLLSKLILDFKKLVFIIKSYYINLLIIYINDINFKYLIDDIFNKKLIYL